MPKPHEPSVSGTVVRQQLEVIRERFGEPFLGRAVERLTDEQRQALSTILPVEWLPVSTIEAFYAAMADLRGRPVPEVHREVAREATERTLKTVWRVLLRLTTDEALVLRAPIFHGKTYDTGTLAARILAPGRAELELTGWPQVPEFVRRGLGIGITSVLAVAGRRSPAATDEARRDGAVFAVTWRA